jgi:membrane associated rhomboid family serine protease
MPQQPTLRMDFPKPRGAVKVMLFVIGGLSLLNAILVNWMGVNTLLEWTIADQHTFPIQVYRLVTSLLITSPAQYAHALFSLMLLYFFGPAVETQTGTRKFLALFFGGGILGTLLGFAANATGIPRLTSPFFFGPTAALETLVVAWSMQNANAVVQMFFVLPMRGAWMKWISLGFCVLGLLYKDAPPEGALAGFGGFFVGVLFGGNTSVVRSFLLRRKLGKLERERAHVRGKGGPPLRVVYGGLADELDLGKGKGKPPPKDKRTLN